MSTVEAPPALSELDFSTSRLWAMEENALHAMMQTVAAGKPLGLSGRDAAPQQQGKKGAVQVIPVFGVLTRRMAFGTNMERLGNWLSDAGESSRIGSIVLLFDSPGGEVSGIQEMASAIRAAGKRKPIIAAVDTMAASGAYWLAAQANRVVIAPSGVVGSVGVVMATGTRAPTTKKKVSGMR